jgi:hypothetical protein
MMVAKKTMKPMSVDAYWLAKVRLFRDGGNTGGTCASKPAPDRKN